MRRKERWNEKILLFRFNNATIEAQWMIFSLRKGKKLQVIKNVSFTEPTGGQNYAALVSAQSRALGQLSREIAEAIKALPK